MGTHWSVLSILCLSPLCHGYSLECPDNPLFVSIVSWVLIGVSCQFSICLQYVMCTHWSVLSILYLSPVCHVYSLECLVNPLFVSSMSRVLIGVSCQSSICLHCVMGTHWSVLSILYLSPLCHGYSLECLVNPLFVSSMSWVLIGSVLTIVNLSPVCHGYSLECLVNPLFVSIVSWVLIGVPDNPLFVSIVSWVLIGVSCQSSICLQYVMGTHWSVLSILYLSPVCHGYSLGVS